MTDRFVALIRGINVGRAKRVAMADLRALVGDLGCHDVKTLLNSGNVVFQARGVEPERTAIAIQIQEGIQERLGVSARVTVLTAAELSVAVAENPLLEVADNPSRLLVAVPADRVELAKLRPLTDRDWAPEAFALGVRVAYLWCPEGVLASPLADAVNKILGDAVTTRNWNTMVKLLALAAPG